MPYHKEKSTLIAHVLKLYRKIVEIIANFQWSLFFKTGSFNRKANIKHLNCPLSERFKSTIQYHVVVPTLESFIANVQERFKEIVLSSILPEKTKRVLLYLNSREEWLIPKSEKALWIDKDKNKHEYEICRKHRKLQTNIKNCKYNIKNANNYLKRDLKGYSETYWERGLNNTF
ncbi:MAG: hypothetical protein QXO48_04870 [Desulfurococcaceae archaeon]